MARRERDSVYDTDSPDLLFGSADDADFADDRDADDRDVDDDRDELDERPAGDADGRSTTYGARPSPVGRSVSRAEARQASRGRHRRRVLAVSATVIVLLLGAAVYFIGLPVYRYFSPADYDGAGSGSVVVTVHANDGATQIGDTLRDAGVIASERAFTNAAENDDRAQNIQPGSYRLRKGMSADNALALLLNPTSRVDSDTVVPEGANIFAVEQLLARPTCGSSSGSSADGCGLGVSKAQVIAALKNIRNLGIPIDYLNNGKDPSTAEGFLYPATYSFDAETTVAEALQQMVGKFTDVARSSRFSTAAKAQGISPYEALILASVIQAEAKFPADMPKVARVILNRMATKTPLQVDATSVYAAELAGVDPKTTSYARIDSPYNTYRNLGLPPSPISNPGSDALKAAVNPAAGNWTFYVNGDAKGNLYFTNNEADFIKAQKRCADNGWGCAQP